MRRRSLPEVSDRRRVPGSDVVDMTISAGIAGTTTLVDFVKFDDMI